MKYTLIAVLASIVILFAGCRTFDPVTGTKVYDPVKTEAVMAALEPVASGAIRRVIKNSPGDAPEIVMYMNAVGSVFCNARVTGYLSPEQVLIELDKIAAPRISPERDYIIDIKNALLALYRINYGDRFRAELPPDKWPFHVAGLICDSIDQGLKDSGYPGVQ